ncbi:c-type cytochrome [Cupriavidus sp. CP313]
MPLVRRVLAIGLLLGSLSGCDFLRGYAEGESAVMRDFRAGDRADDLGAARFVFDDFGGLSTDTLETNALPWKLATTALLLAGGPGVPVTQDALRRALREFGFIYPDAVRNWPRQQQPRFDKPLGVVSGMIGRDIPKIRLEVSNLGCASCHAGITYGKDGRPTNDVWLGLPNTSLNLDAFVAAVYQAVKRVKSDPEKLLSAIHQLYPDTSKEELDTIRKFVWPRLVKRVAELEASGDEPLPFSNGAAGSTNGVAALKFQFHLLSAGIAASGSTSIPELGYRSLRSSLLYDGVYTSKGAPRFAPVAPGAADDAGRLAHIVAFFTVPTMGMPPDRAGRAIPQVEDVMRFMAGYTPPPFPGPVDRPRAARGRAVFDAHCAQCHGSYSQDTERPRLVSFPNRLVAQADIGTDPTRWQAIDPGLLQAISRSELGKHIDAANTGGYVAPILSGVWATAPYLHNGSVPTLWHLMHPQARPRRFWVGGHALDYGKLGIAGRLEADGTWAYPASYQPWSKPVLYDTATAGRDNRGHEQAFSTLAESDKDALLEFLKLL